MQIFLANMENYTYLCNRNNNKNDFIMNAKQIYHYLLSRDEQNLVAWYNNSIVDPWGDYQDQIIRLNTEKEQNKIKSTYDLQILWAMMQDKRTKIDETQKYIAVLGGEEPYIITFDSFEEFLTIEENLTSWVEENPELLDELNNIEKEEPEEDWLDHAHEVLDAYFPEVDSEIRATFACEYWQNGNTDEKNLKDFEQYIKDGQN